MDPGLKSGIPKRAETYFSPTEKWFDLSVYPTGDYEFTVLVQDVSELKRQKEKYQKIFDLTPALISIAGTDGYFRELNAAWETTLGYTKEELNARPLSDFMHPDDVAPTRQEIRNQLDGRATRSFVNRYRHKDGSYRYLEWEATPAEGSSLYAVAKDITERKVAESRLEQLLAEKETVMKEVQHRVKNTMNTMGSILSLQAEDLRQRNPDAAAALDDAKGRFQSMEVLYDQLYRTDTHDGGSVKEYLTQLVRSALSLFPAGDTVRLTEDIDDIRLDAKRLSAVGIIMNELVTNAMKHAFASRSDGEIVVSVRRQAGRITITVADNGPGFRDSLKETPECKGAPDSSFGMTMIEALTGQLAGTIRFEQHGGLRAILEFPD